MPESTRYTRHNWVDGDKVSKELLNNIETGIQEALLSGSYVTQAGSGSIAASSFGDITYSTLNGDKKVKHAEVTINFNKSFASIPYINVSAYTSGGSIVHASYSAPSISGFTLVIEREGGAVSTAYSWSAMLAAGSDGVTFGTAGEDGFSIDEDGNIITDEDFGEPLPPSENQPSEEADPTDFS